MAHPILVDEAALKPGEKIALRRNALMEQGLNDWAICRALGKELGMTPKAVEGRLRSLAKKGALAGNPNKQVKTGLGRRELITRRDSMMAQGHCDGAIAALLSETSGRPAGSLKTAICALVRAGALEKNPNAQKEFGPEEYAWMKKRREGLRSLGLNDTSISRVLALESGARSAGAIRRALWDLVWSGLLEKNGNRGNPFYEGLIMRRQELMREGKGEAESAKEMAKEYGKHSSTIRLLMHRAAKAGACPPNPN